MRFSDSIVGKKKFQNHLDMHFRQNRQASNQTGRGYNRSWMVGVEVRQTFFTLLCLLVLIFYRIGFEIPWIQKARVERGQ